jgi:hypothetical protein
MATYISVLVENGAALAGERGYKCISKSVFSRENPTDCD